MEKQKLGGDDTQPNKQRAPHGEAATHWHGKCNLLCKMKNRRREGEVGDIADRDHADIAIELDGQTDRQAGRQTERHTRGRQTKRAIIEPTITATGGYKHNSIFI